MATDIIIRDADKYTFQYVMPLVTLISGSDEDSDKYFESDLLEALHFILDRLVDGEVSNDEVRNSAIALQNAITKAVRSND